MKPNLTYAAVEFRANSVKIDMMPLSELVSDTKSLTHIQEQIWDARIPLEIRLSVSESRLYEDSEPYVISFPRLSYLPFLSPRLLNHFSDEFIAKVELIDPEVAYFTFEGVPLKWHLPIGLLYDIHILSTQDVNHDDAGRTASSERKAQPFRLMVHFSQRSDPAQHWNIISPTPAVVHDHFINSVKEADFLRSGTAKPIMSLNAADSKSLWTATQENDLITFSRIHAGLLPSDTPWRNIPLRIYLPSNSTEPTDEKLSSDDKVAEQSEDKAQSSQGSGQIRVIQSQVPPTIANSSTTTINQLRQPISGQNIPQTLGTALHSLLPALFPSKRTPILAKPLLHGAPIPMNAVLEEVASKACYADGWVNIVVAITT